MSRRQARRIPAPNPYAPDLGPQGLAALARPVIDTVVKTRDHAKVVARQVLTQPLDVYHHDGDISDAQLEAGHRLAKSLHTAQGQRTTARFNYASDAGLDDEVEVLSDEERHAQRNARFATQVDARRLIGEDLWPTCEAVAEGYWIGRLGSKGALRDGLQRLVVGWKIPNDGA